ncbi:hypothetical protein J2TS4_46930 [Paenibacillus sp. J2TS4]|nr:hypothetical protein J2TS4_46930 [Paenibacillus sp. J2TS4]
MDRDKHMENLRRELMELPRTKKAQLLLVEFSRFLSRFFRSKEHFVNDHLLDAYSSVEEAMSHWARIVVIEHGGDIHGQIWEQVKRYNAGVHKLYEELILSEETLSQRVELVMLACEFSIVTQMESCCSILLELLNSRHQPWSAAEIRQHPSIAGLDVDISLLLGVLAKKTLIREVLIGGEMGDPIQIKYTC